MSKQTNTNISKKVGNIIYVNFNSSQEADKSLNILISNEYEHLSFDDFVKSFMEDNPDIKIIIEDYLFGDNTDNSSNDRNRL